ncbi:hypothetical protein GM537_13695 [Streptococcus pneumoniae]|uniref:Uncharacterized protein n=2 Tax=Streptococcus pneumoniae TaxID=1313 RepID=A0A6G2DX31_STREE|nr:hypothetical protein [Streptococcus pneumoniae]
MEAYSWICHAYRHPNVRERVTITAPTAKRLIERLLKLSEAYPTLLFNEGTTVGGRHQGFVHFHEALLQGAEPSLRVLSHHA